MLANVPEAFAYVAKKDLNGLIRVLDDGGDPNAVEQHNQTSLLIQAAYTGQHEMVKVLVKRGAWVDHTDKFKQTALHYAVFVGKPRMVKVLLDLGANITIVSESGLTPVSLAAKKRIVAVMILFNEFLKGKIKEDVTVQKEIEWKKVEETKKKEFQNQLAKLEHVKQKIEKERRLEEDRTRQQNAGALHWQAKVRCLFISNIIEFSEVKDKTERFIDVRLPGRPRVTNITKIRVDKDILEERNGFLQTLYDPRRTVMKFYGNSVDNISDVISSGRFFPSNKLHKKRETGDEKDKQKDDNEEIFGTFGYGVYFTSDSNTSALHCGEKGRFLLYCEVNIGRSLEISKPEVMMGYNELTERGYDSLYISRDAVGNEGIEYEQFVVYHPFQARPVYLVEYEL